MDAENYLLDQENRYSSEIHTEIVLSNNIKSAGTERAGQSTVFVLCDFGELSNIKISICQDNSKERLPFRTASLTNKQLL